MSGNIYDSRQGWMIIFILIAAGIIISSVLISNSFSSKLAEEERTRMEIWAEATRLLIDLADPRDSSQCMNLITHIITSNTSIPILICNEDGHVEMHRNIRVPEKNQEKFLQEKMKELKSKNPPIMIDFGDGRYQSLYHNESTVLKRLKIYPYIQLAVVFLFILVAFLALLSVKRAEQNKVWVGLSKETAHQLGTPISSLIAWVEYLKSKEVDAACLKEMEKDVKRLETISERFSKIGSEPNPMPLNINDMILSACEYMSIRISAKVKLKTELTDEPIFVLMNDSLFSWVIENLTKNAVDAMEGRGEIVYRIENNAKKVYIDITDAGKGIAKSRFKTIFNPGYTTKERGWGLGLSLVKRIVELYPGGKIYVKNSELGKGTTFRIELRKYHG